MLDVRLLFSPAFYSVFLVHLFFRVLFVCCGSLKPGMSDEVLIGTLIKCGIPSGRTMGAS
jgi:hypothetical protein